MNVENWRVYLILCENGALYCDINNRPQGRFAAHLAGEDAKHMRLNKPAVMRIASDDPSKSEALKREIAIKKLTAGRKRVLQAEAEYANPHKQSQQKQIPILWIPPFDVRSSGFLNKI